MRLYRWSAPCPHCLSEPRLAAFSILNDPEYGTDAYMKVTLIYKELPIKLEEMGGMWLGIGFGKNTMLGSDIVICQWNDTNGKTRCSDHQANTTVYPSKAPPEDVTLNVWTVSGFKADNRLELTFKRFLQTPDSTDYRLSRDTTLNLIWAFGYPDKTYHGTKNRGSQVILFDQTLATSAI